MFRTLNNTKRGFTLIELLVVIAIIGILSSVVLASLGTAREKARDATRISDVKNIQLALELYYDGRQAYPGQIAAATYDAATLLGDVTTWTAAPFVPTYIPRLPVDPSSRGATFAYSYVGIDAAATPGICNGAYSGNQPVGCASYRLGAALERADNLVLTTDEDVNVGAFFAQDSSPCGVTTAAANGHCYALKP